MLLPRRAVDVLAQQVQVTGVARGLLDHVHQHPAQVHRIAAVVATRVQVEARGDLPVRRAFRLVLGDQPG